MPRATSLLLVIAACTAASTVSAAAAKRRGGAMDVLAPHLVNSAVSMLTGTSQQDTDAPHISLKVMPSKRIHLSPSEMNALIFTIKQEIHRKDLLERRHENEKHLSAWALNQAPVYMPFRGTNIAHDRYDARPDNPAQDKNKRESTLQMEVQKIKQKADAETSVGKPATVSSDAHNEKKEPDSH
ncbi:membrane protein, putative [Babesia bigemina]|uniref:Membrane protein, putative n=1 Tax=Babesia bigemina TaxID=5866 RepID=A0A061DBH9_BABBI|nr:membrane protein, putativve, putative [Babesia bigemina]CDR95105.1 membrane protein, putative [Babesia bigemina]|eukprot:XP_012767291.1 membrane protein, putativve, putative [Babesia bigemina]